MEMDVRTALEMCRELKTVHQRLQVLKDLGLGLSDAWRGDAEPFRWRGTALKACERDGKSTV